MNKPIISVFASAYRIHWWRGMYDSLATNKVSFEIVFVGQNKPDFKLPNNFKYIYSNVKPAQCLEIALKQATGEFIMNMSDDWLFSDSFLDNLCKEAQSISKIKENFVLSPMQKKANGSYIHKKYYGFWSHLQNFAILSQKAYVGLSRTTSANYCFLGKCSLFKKSQDIGKFLPILIKHI